MSAQGLGLSIPLRIDSYDGPFALIKDQSELIKQNIKMLVLTTPGERIGFPKFGVGLRRYLFENADNKNLSVVLKRAIEDQINLYLPYIRLNEVIVGFGIQQQNLNEAQNRYLGDIESSPNRLNVQIIYSFRNNLNFTDSLYLEVSTI